MTSKLTIGKIRNPVLRGGWFHRLTVPVLYLSICFYSKSNKNNACCLLSQGGRWPIFVLVGAVAVFIIILVIVFSIVLTAKPATPVITTTPAMIKTSTGMYWSTFVFRLKSFFLFVDQSEYNTNCKQRTSVLLKYLEVQEYKEVIRHTKCRHKKNISWKQSLLCTFYCYRKAFTDYYL